MAFANVRFPVDLAPGTRGGPRHQVYAELSDSAADEVVQRWDDPLRIYDVGYGYRSKATVAALLTFFLARRGPLIAFRFKDFADFTSSYDHVSSPTALDQQLGAGNGASTQFGLRKTYSSGGSDYSRPITKPVSGTVLIAVDGVQLASTDFDVCYETGAIHFVTPPGNNLIITAGFEFDVPVRFKDDFLLLHYDDPSSWSVDSIQLIEVRDEELWTGHYLGDSEFDTLATNRNLTIESPRVQCIKHTAGGSKRLYLPPKASLNEGGPQFVVISEVASTAVFSIYDVDTDSNITNVSAGQVWRLDLMLDGSNNKEWIKDSGTLS